jgi:hypothetical protein
MERSLSEVVYIGGFSGGIDSQAAAQFEEVLREGVGIGRTS